MAEQHITNLGNRIELNQASKVTDQYGPQGALGDFVTVLESPRYDQDGLMQQFCVQTWIGPSNLPVGQMVRKLAILGKLSWGIGGANFTADFDWKVGNQLSFAASWFRIDAAFSEIGTNCPDKVSIGAMQSSGGRASRCQVTRSYPFVTVADGEPRLFPIPPFAHALYLFSSDVGFYDEGAAQIRYVGGASADYSTVSTDLVSFVADGAFFKDALVNEDGVRFPETARVVEVTVPEDSEDVFDFTPVFTLNL